MQVLKDDIRQRILEVARQEFSLRGFSNVTMREISAKARVSVSNLYNYYPCKDELFRSVVSPVISACYAMFDRHHGEYGADAVSMTQDDYFHSVVSEYMTILRGNRTLLKILLFKSRGSSLENFKADFTDRATAQVKAWFTSNKLRHPDMNTDVSDFMIHLHTLWMFTMFEELLMRRITDKYMERAVKEYINFEINGWKNILRI